jgi:L-lactate utilization protein LutB
MILFLVVSMDTVKGIVPEDDREHIISLYGHVKGVEREIQFIKDNDLKNLKEDVEHLHRDIDKMGGKIDKIYWVVLSTVGAVGLMVIETLMGML